LKTQLKITSARRAKVFPRRLLRFIALQLRYVADKSKKNHNIERPQQKPSPPVKLWQVQLEKMQPVLACFRLKIDPDELIRRSEDILKHRFSLLGLNYADGIIDSSTASKYAPIMWRRDPGSGYEWPRNVWYRHCRGAGTQGADIKSVWELSRCQYFILLGEAYALTGNEKYAAEFKNQINDWINNNPFRYGPNWAVTMEVGIRVSNWLVSLLFFLNSSELTDDFFSMLLASAEQHGKHIMSNLENISLITSNHTLGNFAGLYVLSVLSPVLKQSRKWRFFAKRELEREIFKQTFEDGWNFESSTAYHRLVTEMFLYPFLLGDFLDEPFSEDYAGRLRKMIEVLGETAKPNGRIPQIGDNDNGRFLIFQADRDAEDLRIDYLLETAQRNPRVEPKIQGVKSDFFPEAGRYLFRNPRICMLVSAGPKGQAGGGGHAHNDVLSFELNVDGEDIIVDPGTYCYTVDSDNRNQFRSVLNHNTLSWKGLEPCSFDKGLFSLPEQGALNVENCRLDSTEDYFSAVYKYKNRFHRREIRFKKEQDEIEMIDSCSHKNAFLTFVFAPGIDPVKVKNGFTAGKAHFSFDRQINIGIESGQYSPAYGKLLPNKIIRAKLSGTKNICNIRLNTR